MALTGLQIFKLLPKSNCRQCNFPTCLAFAMQLAQKKVSLDACPDASDDARQALAAAAEPPIRLVKFGRGDTELQLGHETVMFRHEEKFYHPTVLAVTVSDELTEDQLDVRLETIRSLKFERVGSMLSAQAVAVINDSGAAEPFARAAAALRDKGDLAIILCTASPEAAGAALEKVADQRPLLAWADSGNAQAMAELAKANDCPLVVQGDSLEQTAELAELARNAGAENLVLSFADMDHDTVLRSLSRARALALKKAFRPLGFPSLARVSDGDDHLQAALASSLICKYAGIVVLDTVERYAWLAMLTVIMNIYTDPQKPIQVSPELYAVGNADENSPVLFTTNFSLTYYTVESDAESSRVPCHILVVDTEGTSVLTAYSGDKLNEKAVAKAIQDHRLNDRVKHRKLIIPGYVAVMSGALEEETGWQVLVGPRESAMLGKYLQEVWQ